MTKTIFCANCQADKDHDAGLDAEGGLLLTCPDCERNLKFPSGIDASQLDDLIAEHKEANEGQVSVAAQLEKFGLTEDSSTSLDGQPVQQ